MLMTQDRTIRGTAGNDTLTGSAIDDLILGGAGNDIINGGTGTNVLSGGTGTDTAMFDFRLTEARVSAENGRDVVSAAPPAAP